MSCAGGDGASGSGALLGLAGHMLKNSELGTVGLTSVSNSLKYSPMGWAGNQYVKMTQVADLSVVKGLGPIGFSLESFGNFASWNSGGSNGKFALDMTMTAIGTVFPLHGASYTLAPIVGPRALDTAIKMGPKPQISHPNRYDQLHRDLRDAGL